MKNTILILALAAHGATGGAQSPLKLDVPGGSLKFGLLFQPQFESAGALGRDGQSQNFFLRRTRFLLGGTFAGGFEIFLETDKPNIGKSDPTGAKTLDGLNIQDAVLTYKVSDALRIETGLLLVPGAHISNQGATSLNGLDYPAYAFLQTGVLNNNLGRDTGLQARGMLLGGHLEYRGGVYQGKRDGATTSQVASRNPMRVAARLQYNAFDAEGGAFLGGTYGGAKRILSFGLAHDRQGDYRMTAADALLDWPLAGDVLTLQVDHWWYEGTGAWVLPKQSCLFAEGSWRFRPLELAPLVRYERRSLDKPAATLPDESRYGVGLAWWIKGHTSHLKAYWQRVKPSAPGLELKEYDQFTVQWQFFQF